MEFRNCKWQTEKFFAIKFKRLQKMQLAVFMAVPFVSDYISMNACIFVELGNLCDKIADYAMQIVKETENAADLFHRANNSHHSILNYDRQIIIEYNRNTNR